jgi:coenzyme F420-0:L-glutamate ligase/coenzyme F420-1:gamma-L-glutamate ligase
MPGIIILVILISIFLYFSLLIGKRKMKLEIIGVTNIPEIEKGNDLANILGDAIKANGIRLNDGDIVVFTSKIISKSEGRIVDLSGVKVGEEARRIAKATKKNPGVVQLIIEESKEMIRVGSDFIVCETRQGFVCANAGIDESNVGMGKVALLPQDPQRSASSLRKKIEEGSGKEIAVLIADSCGRAFRDGVVGTCIGVSGIPALLDRRGEEDRCGKISRITKVGIADEICAASNLVMGEFKESIPIAIVQGLELPVKRSEGDIKEVLFSKEEDVFR